MKQLCEIPVTWPVCHRQRDAVTHMEIGNIPQSLQRGQQIQPVWVVYKMELIGEDKSSQNIVAGNESDDSNDHLFYETEQTFYVGPANRYFQ